VLRRVDDEGRLVLHPLLLRKGQPPITLCLGKVVIRK
jgi:hypothetical protein